MVVARDAVPVSVAQLIDPVVRTPEPVVPSPIVNVVVDGDHNNWFPSVFVQFTTALAPTVPENMRYFDPAETVLEVVTVAAVDAVPVRLAVTVVHVNVPPVLVKASVFGLYVSEADRMLRDEATVPVNALLKSRLYTTADVLLLISIELPDPGAPDTRPTSNTAALEVPTLTNVGVDPGASAVTVPTAIVAAEPCDPV
jgi:hypothetical protein